MELPKVGDVVGKGYNDMHCTTLAQIKKNGYKGFFGPDLSDWIIVGEPLETSDPNCKIPYYQMRREMEACLGTDFFSNKTLYCLKIMGEDSILVGYSYDGRNAGVAILRPKNHS